MNVVQAKTIRPFRADWLKSDVGILNIPTEIFQEGYVVAKRKVRGRPSPAGIFPLGLGRQAISGLLFAGEPLAISLCVVPSYVRRRHVIGDSVARRPPTLATEFVFFLVIEHLAGT